MATEHTAKKQRLLTEAAAKPGERTDDKENAPPINAASVARPRKWERFLTAGEDRGPIQLVERFDVGLLQRIMAVHKGEIWKDTLKQANTMLRKAGTSGALSVPYEQSNYKKFDPENRFKGSYRLGRYCAKGGGSMQGLWHMIRNTLAHESYWDIDMVNAHPKLAAQLFGHLPIPTYLAYASNRQHFLDEFTGATGLGAAYCKKAVASVMNGSPMFGFKCDTDWKEMWTNPETKEGLKSKGIASLHDLNMRLSGLRFLADLRAEREIIYRKIQHDYPDFYAVCEKKAAASGKGNAGGTAFSLLMGDMENECLMVMLGEVQRLDMHSDEMVLAFDGMMLPKCRVSRDDLPSLMAIMEEAVEEKTGFKIELAEKPMKERFEIRDVDPAAMLRDTTKGGRAMLSRCIRRLSATHEAVQREMTDLAIERSSKKKQLERLRATECKSDQERAETQGRVEELQAEIDALSEQIVGLFYELFAVVGENTLKVAITNKRGVVVGYDDYSISSLQNSNYAAVANDIKEWIRSGNAPCYRRSVTSFGGPMASDIFNDYCGLFIEQQCDIVDCDYDLEEIQPMLEHVKRAVGHSDVHYNLLLDDMADFVQNPHMRAPHVWVIMGGQGSGKSGLMDVAFVPIYGCDDPEANNWHGGRGLYVSFRDSFQVLREKFGDPSFGRKIIVFDDEQGNGDLYQRRGALKNFISTSYRVLESKNVTAKMAKEYSQLFILTNDFNVVDLEDIQQRRYIVVEMDGSMRGNKAYFDRLFALGRSEAFCINWFKFLMSRDLTQHNRYNPNLPQTDIMRNQYIEGRPAGPTYLYQRFLSAPSHDPILHCLENNCKGNGGDKFSRQHVAGKPCPNQRIPNSWVLSWDMETKVPRQAVMADYDIWLTEQRRNKRYKEEGHLWQKQFDDYLKKHELVLNKPAGGKSDFTKTEHGVTAQEQKQTVTVERESQLWHPSATDKKDKGKARASATSVERIVIHEIGTWSKLATCYQFPPLKRMWATMVKCGWLRPDDVMPSVDETDYQAMLIDDQS